MSTPRELLSIRDDLAQKVAERQIDRHEAIADLRAAAGKFPDWLDKLADDWADTEIDRGVKKYVNKRNRDASAEAARRLAELGLEQPTLNGDVVPISEFDPNYAVTLADDEDYVRANLASAWRLVKSFEAKEEEHELFLTAVDGDKSVTREQALNALKRMPEAKRRSLRLSVEAALSAERQIFVQRRYGTYGQAAEG